MKAEKAPAPGETWWVRCGLGIHKALVIARDYNTGWRVKYEQGGAEQCVDRGSMFSAEKEAEASRGVDVGPDGYLWQLWEYDGEIRLQRQCDEPGCERGLKLYPARDCGACGGSGYRTRTFKLAGDEADV